MRESDLEDLYALLSDQRVMRYLEKSYTREQTERFLRSAGLSDPPLVYAVEDAEGFAGYVICHDYDAGSTEIGWVLRPERWGKGYASRLTERLIADPDLSDRDLVIECAPEQAVTRHIALKYGFSYEGDQNGLTLFRLKAGR